MSVTYTAIDLGALGGADTIGAAINSSGQIVGLSTTANGDWHGFFCETAGEPLRDLGTLPGSSFSAAWDINDAGLIIGQVNINAAWEIEHAALWEGGILRDLGTLGGEKSYASAVNNHGQIVGAARLSIAASRPKSEDELVFVDAEDTHAFLWEGGVMRDLGTLGGDYSEASSINDAGVIVGSVITEDDSIRAFILDPANGNQMQIIEPLPRGGYSATAHIDAAGRIVGSSTADAGLVPVIYHDGPPRALAVPDGITITKAKAQNARGEIVGHAQGSMGATRALLWRDNRLIELNDLVQIGPGWVLTEARDINDAGQIVVNAQHGDRKRALLLLPSDDGRG